MNSLNDLVEQLLSEHTGGVPFFDALDDCIKCPDIIETLFQKIHADYPQGISIIMSGKFGRYVHNILHTMKENHVQNIQHVLTVNGSLRAGVPIDDLSIFRTQIQNVDYVFVDDSLYKGRTLAAVREEIERLEGRVVHTYVVYDGSNKDQLSVSSLYRYRDHYPIKTAT